ncbi:peptide transporter ptr2 [Coemansia javaensis]|uniref:Peptide transporter ptr2 n=1 Tax=Coemansia javaensis TaxID=2761396 RepID=A0A9W8H869_9FUNG|nr:peptide transporter ptr2 [Coemansia javaensis]
MSAHGHGSDEPSLYSAGAVGVPAVYHTDDSATESYPGDKAQELDGSIEGQEFGGGDDDDYLREGERWPTAEDKSTLTRVADRVPRQAFLIIATEFCERFTYYGVSGLFQNYIQNGYKVPGSNPGALGRGKHTAAGLGNFLQFWCYITPILGAVIADQYWGKYRTILVFSVVYLVGDLVLTLTSIPVSIRAGGAFPGLVIAIIIIGLATGAVKSNVSPMVAEQYRRTRPFVRRLKSGREVLVDRDATIQSIFNWFYWAINVGSLSSIATTELEHNVDFWPAYLLPTLMFVVCIGVFWLGRNKYVRTPPTGSIVVKAAKCIATGVRRAYLARRGGPVLVDAQGRRESWIEYAKPSTMAEVPASVTWDDKFVGELRRTLRACKVFLFFPIYWLCYGQMSNNLVAQAGEMNTGSVPNDIIQNLDPICLIIFIPIFDMGIYPALRRCGIVVGPITRIFIGFLLAAVSMAYAAIVQHLVYSAGPYYDSPGSKFNNISAAIQIPAYIFIAWGEIFASISGLEYAYTRAPAAMKSIIMSIYLFTNCGGAILAFCFNPILDDPKLVENFAIAGGLMGAFAFLFYACFWKYDRS